MYIDRISYECVKPSKISLENISFRLSMYYTMQYMCLSLSNCYKLIQIFSSLIGYGSKYRTDVVQVCVYRSGNSFFIFQSFLFSSIHMSKQYSTNSEDKV